MTMRKMLAILATLAILCTVLPLSAMFSAVADGNVIENTNFDDGEKHGWGSSSELSVEDGVLVFSCTKDWANVYKYANGMKPNTDYVYTFRAKANMNSTMNIKINDNWAADSAHVKFDVTTEWQEFTVDVNSGDYKSAAILMFSVNVPASTGMVFYLDYVTITEGTSEPVTPDEPADGNLIVNGDFETGDASGWETWQSTTISADAAKDGAYGAHLVGNGSWGGMLNQTVTVVPGNQYKLSFWINVNAMGVNVQVKNGAGVAIEGAGGWFDGNKKDKLVEWSFTATDDKVFINFCGSGSAPEDVYVDNFSLVCTGEAPAEPSNDGYIINGDFETGDIKPWDNLWGGCPTAEVIEGGKDSKYALNIVSKQWNHVRQTGIAVEANTDYKISVWAKNANNMCLLVKDGGDTADLANVGVNAGAEWTQFTVEFNSGSNTSILFSLMGGEGSDQYGVFDNVVMEKVGSSEPDTPDEPDEPVTPPASGDVLNATFDGGEFDGILSSSNISVEDGALIFDVNKDWGNIYTGFNVDKNTDYEITLRAKSKLAKSFWVKLHKGDWTGDIAQADLKLTKDWAEYTFTLNTGDNDYAYLLVQYAGYAAEGEVAYFDYITVKKVGGSEPDAPVVDSGIVNGGFENGSEGWELGSAASITDEDAHSGKNSLKLENPGMWAAAAVQNVPVKANTEYVVEMWFYRVSNKGAMNLFMMDAADNRNLTVVEGQNWFNTNTTDWEKRTIVINTGAATEIVLKWSAEATNAGILLIDDMTIYEKNAPQPPSSDNLVVNGDFETGDTSGWEKWQSTVVTEEAAKNGKYGVNLIGDGGWGGLLNQTFAVENGETYVITLWICPNTGGANLNIKGADKVEGECDNTWMTVGEINGWTKRTFNVVANSDEMTLNFCGGGNNIAADLYLDDIVVTKKGAGPVVDETSPIKNAGFETGDLTSWINLWDSCIYSFDTPGYKGSNFALNYAAEGQWRQIRQDKIPVEKNTDYVVVGYVKNPMNVNIVVKTGDDSANINEVAIENDMSNKWVRAAVEFNSGDLDSVCVLLISREAVASAIWDDVQIYKKGEEPTGVENDDVVTEGPISLDSFGVAINRPSSEDANLIVNGSFENAEGGQWQSIISDTLYVVDDETAPEGNKSLFFNTSGVSDKNKVIFYLDVEPNTDYVFSAWVKGAFISADNRFNATFGVTDWKDNFCVYADAVFSNKNRQIVPTAWDNEWHLRSVQFNSGSNIKVGIGFAGAESQMWIDGIALYDVLDGVKYADPRQIDYIMPNILEKNEGGCADENNLIVDSTMGSADAQEFWASAEGFKNGFISFPENEYEYGTSLKYTGDAESCYTHAIKWLTVEPNTEYTFSVDVRVVKSGGGSLTLLDGKKRECSPFLVVDFDQYDYGTDWFNVTVKFDSGEFDRIGIAIVDGGGEALVDNMRLFETKNTIAGGVDDNYIEPPYSFGDPEDPTDPDSPATGVSVMGAILAVALVPASAAAAFKLRRKKEDEE